MTAYASAAALAVWHSHPLFSIAGSSTASPGRNSDYPSVVVYDSLNYDQWLLVWELGVDEHHARVSKNRLASYASPTVRGWRP